MKTAIKIATIKIAALAVVIVLGVLACAPEVSLTNRDYSERNETRKAEYTNSMAGITIPTVVAVSSLQYNSAGVGDTDREIKVTLDKNSDVLKESGSDITAKLKEFLNFFTFTVPAYVPDTYQPSGLSTALGYTFVRRDDSGTDSIIVIRLDSVPNFPSIVWKIDASKYKCYGQVLDFNEDGIGGEIYDDLYDEIQISGNSVFTPSYGDFLPPVTSGATMTFSFGGGSFAPGTAVNSILFSIPQTGNLMKEMFNEVLPKIEFQRYSQAGKVWVKDGAVSVYDGITTPAPTGLYTGSTFYYVSFTPEDMGIYRVKATGMKNLTSTKNYGEKPIKIKVSGGTGGSPSTPSFFNDTVYTAAQFCYTATVANPKTWQTATTGISDIYVTSDNEKKNVVIDVYFAGIYDSDLIPMGNVYPETLPLDKFNESFKLVYNGSAAGTAITNGDNLTTYNNLVEFKITGVKYEASKRNSPTNTDIDHITITLDPAYQIDGSRAVTLLLAPGFKFNGGHIIVGQNLNIYNTYYNGTFGWRSYGELDPSSTLRL